MAIIELNLEKPALVEEYRYPGETSAGTDSSADASGSTSGGGKGKLLGLLALVAGVGVLAWKLKSRGGSEQTDFDEFDGSEEYEHGPEPDIGGEDESGGAGRKVAGVLGLAVAVASLGVAVRKRRR